MNPDRAWIQTLLQRHEEPLVRYATRLLGGDVQRARDVVQDSFLRLCQAPREKVEGPAEARDFDDDAKDAGEIGVGHAVTALYELVPAGAVWGGAELRYQRPLVPTEAAGSGELMTIRLRAKDPQGGRSRLQTFAVRDPGAGMGVGSDDLDLAAAAACFGMLLRGSPDRGDASWDLALTLALRAAEREPSEARDELVRLILKAQALTGGRIVSY